jgi:hypothetical protein
MSDEDKKQARTCILCGCCLTSSENICPKCGNVFRKDDSNWEWNLIPRVAIDTGFGGHYGIYVWGSRDIIPSRTGTKPVSLLNNIDGKNLTTSGCAEMSCIMSLLEGVCAEIESQLRVMLGGTQRLLIVQFLPQIWVLETEDQVVSLLVNREGHVFAQDMNKGDRDVTIRWRSEYLESVLRTRSTAYVPRDQRPTIIFHTEKGRTAFEFLRERLGLQNQSARRPMAAQQGSGE